MPANSIVLEQHGAITVLKFNQPPANAIDLALTLACEDALDQPEVKEAKALVLTGAGHFFSGGLDLKVVPTYNPDQQREFLGALNRLLGKLYTLPQPVVGAINGHAVAGGFIFALTADYRIGPTGAAHFGLTEARVGIPFPIVPLIVLQAECAPQDVRYCTLFARTFGPEEAYRRGILDELVARDAVLARGLEVANDMLSIPPDAYTRIKYQMRGDAIDKIGAALSSGDDPMLNGWLGSDTELTSLAFLKRPREG